MIRSRIYSENFRFRFKK